MNTSDRKDKKALFHGFPDDNNIEVKNVLGDIERTFLDIGTRIGRYEIIEEIDRGGMAVVYKAYQQDLERDVALKVLPANVTINNNFVERFLAEAHSIAKLQHQNIVTIYETAVEKNIYFLAMEFIPGKNLFYYLNQEKPKLVDVLEIVRKLADALAYAHDQKILHRDLKLNNVIMKDNKDPVLIDFGLAKVIGGKSDNLTKTGEIIGSPAYMAPERIFGKGLDARSDVCSLGIMLYEMLTFKNPYLDPRSMIQTTKNVIEANPVPPRNLVSWLPIEVESITLKSMRGDPEERYQSMKQFSEDIQRYQRGEPIIAKPPSLWSKFQKFFSKHWAVLVILFIILLFSGLIGWIIKVQSEKSRSRWQIVYSQTFNDESSLSNWFADTEMKKDSGKTGTWKIVDSSLAVESRGYTYLRMENPFTTDIKIEFDITSGSKGFLNAGFFVCGNSPKNGYCFHIHKGKVHQNGVTYPESDLLFLNYKQIDFPYSDSYHVTIEKKDHIVTFQLNNIVITKINDFFPKALGKDNQRIGFFVNGGKVIFDNMKVYRQGVPRLARPTIIADRFWEQGDFESALNEYREVLIDLSRSDITRHIQFKVADCLIRLEQYEEAKQILSSLEGEKKISEDEKAKIMFLKGQAYERRIGTFFNNSHLLNLAGLYPESAVNKSVAAYRAIECFDLYEKGEANSAEEHILYLVEKYHEFARYFGNIHLEILADHIRRGKWEKAKSAFNSIKRSYKKDEEITFRANSLIALGHLGRREKYKATDILNQCVGSMQPSVAMWKAWMILGEVYEYDRSYKDAYMVYKKVFDECPKTQLTCWLARLRMGELAPLAQSMENPSTLLKDVLYEPHVFEEPLLVARLYSDIIKSDEFVKKWNLINPKTSGYLYYLARKAVMDKKKSKAHKLMGTMKRLSPHFSWDYVRISRMMDDLYALDKAQ